MYTSLNSFSLKKQQHNKYIFIFISNLIIIYSKWFRYYIYVHTCMYIYVYICIFYSGSGPGGGGRLLTPTGFFKLAKFSYLHSKNTENRPRRTLSSPLIRAKIVWIQNDNLDQGQPLEMSQHLT